VEFAEPNYLRRPTSTPNDPSYSSRQWNFQALDLPRAWDISPGANSSIVVAVVDTGVTTTTSVFGARTWDGTKIVTIPVPFGTNPDLAGARLVSPQDIWGGMGTTVLDSSGHGTHVSGTIGEDTNNALLAAGVAYNVKIMPVKVCGSYWDLQFNWSAAGLPGFFPPSITSLCDSASTAAGIRYAADNGAKIINLSIGGTEASQNEQDAIKYAVGKGAFVAIAAGNDYEYGNPVQYPARDAQDIDGAMAVAAVGRSLKHASYSSSGSYVEIAAPGGDDLDGGTAGMIWQSTIYGPDSDIENVLFPRFDRYAETPDMGTSMAAPHVAGLAALIISRGVTKPAAIEALIKATARDLGAAGRDDLFGHGLIQPRSALLGFGFKR
jgi:serine protease